jgi:SPX domain protein involved in polyphosphate accumulation
MLIVEDLNTKKRTWQKSTAGGHYNFRPGQVIMKFGEQLRTSIVKEYEWYYIAYDELKDQLKTEWEVRPSKAHPKGKRRKWNEDDEAKFLEHLEQELEKVYTKQKVKAIDISRRIESADKEVSDVLSRMANRGPPGSATANDAPSEEEFFLLEEDLETIIADVYDLANFVRLNYTGFQKIVKKHDVSCLPTIPCSN